MRAVLLALVLLLPAGCANLGLGGPCLGQPRECEEAV